MPKAASECGNGKMSHPDHPSQKDFLPQLLREQSADSLQLFQGLPQLQSHFSQGHALPKVAYIQWLIVVIWRSSYFWPIAEQLDVHFTACGGCCLRLRRACIAFHSISPSAWSCFLPLPSTVLISNQYPVPTLHLSQSLFPKNPSCSIWFRKWMLSLICDVCCEPE